MAKRSRAESPDLKEPRDPDSNVHLVFHASDTVPSTSASPKMLHLDSASGGLGRPSPAMLCSLPPHRQTLAFATYDDYEIHYRQQHSDRCTECRKNFPTEHFLNLHIEENHDSFFSVRGEKKFSCFVEDCDRTFSAPQKRRLHLIDKHLFPRNYDFFVINDGIDGRSSMLKSGRHRRRSSAAQQSLVAERSRQRITTLDTSAETEDTADGKAEDQDGSPEGSEAMTPESSQNDDAMASLTGAMSSLKFVPPSVRFGRGRGRGRGRGGFCRS